MRSSKPPPPSSRSSSAPRCGPHPTIRSTRVDAVVRAVFRPAVRRPALLGLVRELSRLPGEQAERLRAHVDPLIEQAVEFLAAEMDAGRLRRGDPRLVAALAYATVTGIATEPEALRGVGGCRQPPGSDCGPSCARSCGGLAP